MDRSNLLRAAAVLTAGAALLLTAAPAAATTPQVETFAVHVERPFVDCPDFATVGAWDITHRLTIFSDVDGAPIRDIERVEFSGRIVNAETGAWVADAGIRTFFDTLAPDGSYASTVMVDVRRSAWIHDAGRTDFQTGAFHGRTGLDADGIAALCTALGG